MNSFTAFCVAVQSVLSNYLKCAINVNQTFKDETHIRLETGHLPNLFKLKNCLRCVSALLKNE